MLLSPLTDFTVSNLTEESKERMCEEDGPWLFFIKGMFWVDFCWVCFVILLVSSVIFSLGVAFRTNILVPSCERVMVNLLGSKM